MTNRTLFADANELMKACDALEARATHREKQCQALMAASLLAVDQSRALLELSRALLATEPDERRHS